MRERSSYSGTWPGANDTHPGTCKTSQFPKNPTHPPPRPTKSSGFPVPAGRSEGSGQPRGHPGGKAEREGTGKHQNRFQPTPKTGGQTPSPSAGQPMAAPASSRPGEALSIRLLPRRGEDQGGAGDGNGAASCSLKPINSFGTTLATQRGEEALNSWPIRPR